LDMLKMRRTPEGLRRPGALDCIGIFMFVFIGELGAGEVEVVR